MTEPAPARAPEQPAGPAAKLASAGTAAPAAELAGAVPMPERATLVQAALPARPGGPGRQGEQRSGRSTPGGVLVFVDVAALTAAVVLSGPVSLAAALYAVAVLIVLAVGGSHRLRVCLRLSDQIGRIVTAVALPLPFLLPWLRADRGWHLALWSAACVLVLRGMVYAVLRAGRYRGVLVEPTLVVGAGEMGVLVVRLLGEHPELGLRPLGFLDACPPLGDDLPLPLLGVAADLPRLISQLRIRRVILCFPVDRDRELVPLLRVCRPLGADILLVPRLQDLGAAIPRAHLDEIWGIPLIPLRRQQRAGLVLKRAFDLVAAVILLCAFAPVLLVLAAVIRARSGGPAIFRQLRLTGHDRAAQILKLRTLDGECDPDTSWTVPAASTSPLGRWLRSSHLDELPQLINVMRGSMSLVGPRPERPYFAEQFSREIPGYRDRTRTRAGITGWAQVNGLHGDTSMRDRVRFDNQYIEYWTPWLDVVILARTLTAAILGVSGSRP